MAKQRKRKRHYNKRVQMRREREKFAKDFVENYYKQQMRAINVLAPVAAAAKRLNDRAAQAERDSRDAARSEKGGE